VYVDNEGWLVADTGTPFTKGTRNTDSTNRGTPIIFRLFHINEHVVAIEHGVASTGSSGSKHLGVKFTLHDDFTFDTRASPPDDLPAHLQLAHSLLEAQLTQNESAFVQMNRLISQVLSERTLSVYYECWMFGSVYPNTMVSNEYTHATKQFRLSLPAALREPGMISTRPLKLTNELNSIGVYLRLCLDELLHARATTRSEPVVDATCIEMNTDDAAPQVLAVPLIKESIAEQNARLKVCHGDNYPDIRHHLGFDSDPLFDMHNTLWEKPLSWFAARGLMESYLNLLYLSFQESAGTDTLSKRKPWVAYLYPRVGYEAEYEALFDVEVVTDDGASERTDGEHRTAIYVAKVDQIRDLFAGYTKAYRARGNGLMLPQTVLPFHVYTIGGLHSGTVVQKLWQNGLPNATPPVEPGMQVYEHLPAHVWHHLDAKQLRCLGTVDNCDTTMTLGTTNWTLYQHLRKELGILCAVEADAENLFKAHKDQRPDRLLDAISQNSPLYDLSRGAVYAWCAGLTTETEIHALIVKKVAKFIQGNPMLTDRTKWANPMRAISWPEHNWEVLSRVNDMLERGEITWSKTTVKAFEDAKKTQEKKAAQMKQKQATKKPKSKFGAANTSSQSATPARSKKVVRDVNSSAAASSRTVGDATAVAGAVHSILQGISVKIMGELGVATDSVLVAKLLNEVVGKVKCLQQVGNEISNHNKWMGFMMAVAHGLGVNVSVLRSSVLARQLNQDATFYLWGRARWARNIGDPSMQSIRNYEHLQSQLGQTFENFLKSLTRANEPPDATHLKTLHIDTRKLIKVALLQVDQPKVPNLDASVYYCASIPKIMGFGTLLYASSDEGDSFSPSSIVSGRGAGQLEQLALSLLHGDLAHWPGSTALQADGPAYDPVAKELYNYDNACMPCVCVSMTDFAWLASKDGALSQSDVATGLTSIFEAIAGERASVVFFDDPATTPKSRQKFVDQEMEYKHRARMLAIRTYLHAAEDLPGVVAVREWSLNSTQSTTNGSKGMVLVPSACKRATARGCTPSNASTVTIVHMTRCVLDAPHAAFDIADYYSASVCDQGRSQVLARGFETLSFFPTPLLPSVTVWYKLNNEIAPCMLAQTIGKVM
jgi:hypothetical protein